MSRSRYSPKRRAGAAAGAHTSSDVLRFWRDVEVFTVPSTPRPGKSPNRVVAAYTDADALPWSPESPLSPLATGEMVWSHAVFVGVAPKSKWARRVLALACPGHKLTPTEFEQLAGDGWLAGFVVGHDGRPGPGSYVPASFALGVERLRRGHRLDGLRQAIDHASFAFAGRHNPKPADSAMTPQSAGDAAGAQTVGAADAEDIAHRSDSVGDDARVAIEDLHECDEARAAAAEAQQSDADEAEPRGPLTFADLNDELDIALRAMGDVETDAVYRVIIASSLRRRRLKHKALEPQVDLAFLNSFYLNDLDRLLEAAEHTGLESPALAQFLEAAPDVAARQDVLKDPRLMAELARPEDMLLGRWPASSHKPLMFAQQAVVGAIVSKLESAPGLMAVNGPPGTGKTTLLCDIVADVVVKRARALSALGAPWRAFGARVTAGGLAFYPLLADIAEGTGIVVASNNNAAVENITRALPAENKIDRDEHPDADYLGQVAAHVFEVAGVEEPSWGLVAAALGNSDRRYKFSQAFFREGRPQETHGDKAQAMDLKAVLEAAPSDASRLWQDAKDAFEACLKTVEGLRDEAVRVQESIGAQDKAQQGTQARHALRRTLQKALDALPESERAKRKTLNMQLASLADAQTRIDDAGMQHDKAIASFVAAGGVAADAAFFEAPCHTRQLTSLWVHPGLDLARAKLFVAALRLHEATLLACNGKSIANARAVRAMLARDTAEPIADEERAMLWDFLFFCVPVVSSTLASFDRLFEGVAPASLGWLMIDEAGQATPQSVVGALWRSRRAIVIGDPQQVPPVMTAPHALVQELLRRHPIDACWSPATASAQTLADRASLLGAAIDNDAADAVWTGLPLRAHRRCLDPMFSVANRIAYAGQMVQANTRADDIDCGLGPSCWFDVVGTQAEHQLVHEEMARLSDIVWRIQMDGPKLATGERASIFIISPYRRVADAARTLLRTADLGHLEAPIDSGTVHRFQGREADIVILVLGSAPGPDGQGSRHWASHRPNLLNVALTRARARLYVIGNVADWQSCRHFEVLVDTLRAAGAIVGTQSQGSIDAAHSAKTPWAHGPTGITPS